MGSDYQKAADEPEMIHEILMYLQCSPSVNVEAAHLLVPEGWHLQHRDLSWG